MGGTIDPYSSSCGDPQNPPRGDSRVTHLTGQSRAIRLPADHTPLLVVIVDTEAQFQWGEPFSRSEQKVQSVKSLSHVDGIFAFYRIVPTYVLDYAVATQPDGYGPIAERLSDQRCIIGAHLQPWYNPPFDEDVSIAANTYPGNLPPELEYEKLATLTGAIEDNLKTRPRIYRAGRFGIGPNTTDALRRLDYQIDTSILPYSDLTGDGGPNFLSEEPAPCWLGEGHTLLEIPLTVGYTGLLATHGPTLFGSLSSPTGLRLHVPGILSRLHILDRIRLSPEGVSAHEMRRLTRRMLKQGHRLFSFTFHTPSLEPGNTPYVRTDADLEAFLATIESYFDFFFGEAGGRAVTPFEFREIAIGIGQT